MGSGLRCLIGVRLNSGMDAPPGLSVEHIAGLVRKREEAITRAVPALLERFPIRDYVALLARYPQRGAYGHVSRGVRNLVGAIRTQMGEESLQDYHRLLLLHLILRAPERLEQMRLTDELRERTERNLARIAATIESDPEAAFYTYSEDRFRKELAVCRLALIPAGAQKIHLDRLPLRTLALHAPRGTLRLVAELGGVQPCYQMHTDSYDPELMADFNPEGWSRFYQRTARLMELFPRVKCVFGSSWFFDPELEAISPRLTYLRTLVTENGGHLLNIGASSDDLANATETSKTRRRLVEEGRYTPTGYLVSWPRKPLLDWACRAA